MMKHTGPAMILSGILLSLSAGVARAGEKDAVRVVVGFYGQADAQALSGAGASSVEACGTNEVAAFLPASAVAKIRALPQVEYVEEDAVRDGVEDAQVLSAGVDRIDADRAWVVSTGRGVKVAVLDTGIDDSHPDFKDSNGAGRVVLGPNFVRPARSSRDDHGHGTRVTGVAAASHNAIGVVGVAPECTPVAVKVLDSTGSGWDAGIARGIDWAVGQGCAVLNLSLAGPQPTRRVLKRALQRAEAAGTVMAGGAGNSGTEAAYYPAAEPEMICVAAVDSADQLASFSTYGSQVDVAAPGVAVYTTQMGGGYIAKSGTSLACPHVAGTAALVISAGRSGSFARAAIEATAEDIHLAFGLVDAEAAVLSAP